MTPVPGRKAKSSKGPVAEKAVFRVLVQIRALLLSPHGQEKDLKTLFHCLYTDGGSSLNLPLGCSGQCLRHALVGMVAFAQDLKGVCLPSCWFCWLVKTCAPFASESLLLTALFLQRRKTEGAGRRAWSAQESWDANSKSEDRFNLVSLPPPPQPSLLGVMLHMAPPQGPQDLSGGWRVEAQSKPLSPSVWASCLCPLQFTDC